MQANFARVTFSLKGLCFNLPSPIKKTLQYAYPHLTKCVLKREMTKCDNILVPFDYQFMSDT